MSRDARDDGKGARARDPLRLPAGGTGAELLEAVKRDIPRFRKIVQEIGIPPE